MGKIIVVWDLLKNNGVGSLCGRTVEAILSMLMVVEDGKSGMSGLVSLSTVFYMLEIFQIKNFCFK